MKGKFEHRGHGIWGEHHMKMEAEIKVVLLQANKDKTNINFMLYQIELLL